MSDQEVKSDQQDTGKAEQKKIEQARKEKATGDQEAQVEYLCQVAHLRAKALGLDGY